MCSDSMAPVLGRKWLEGSHCGSKGAMEIKKHCPVWSLKLSGLCVDVWSGTQPMLMCGVGPLSGSPC